MAKVVHVTGRSYTPWDEIGVGEIFRSPKNLYQRIPAVENSEGETCEAFCFDTGEVVRGGRGKGRKQLQVVTDRVVVKVGPKAS